MFPVVGKKCNQAFISPLEGGPNRIRKGSSNALGGSFFLNMWEFRFFEAINVNVWHVPTEAPTKKHILILYTRKELELSGEFRGISLNHMDWG